MAKKKTVQVTSAPVINNPQSKTNTFIGVLILFLALAVCLSYGMVDHLNKKVDAIAYENAQLKNTMNMTNAKVDAIVAWGNSFSKSVIYTFGEVANYTQELSDRQAVVEAAMRQAGMLPENASAEIGFQSVN